MVLVFIYRFEYLQCYLRHDGVSVGFNGHVSPFRKGNTVQSTGNPIISATNRGLSWEVVPVWYATVSFSCWVCFVPTRLGIPLRKSFALGVGNIPSRAAIAIVGRSAAPCDVLRLIRPDPASIAVGVGSSFSGMNTVLPFSHCFNPCVCTVGNKPASVPSVGSTDTASRYNVRLNRISCRLQVRHTVLH